MELGKLVFVGLGSQTQSWIQNLRDSGLEASVFLRHNSPSQVRLQELNLKSVENLSEADIVFLLIPDAKHHLFFEENHTHIKDGAMIIYAHGASQLEHKIAHKYPQFSHCLLAIKAIASEIRTQYVNDGKLGAVFSSEFVSVEKKEEIETKLLTIAKKVGITAGPFKVTFEQEARADLFSEQSLLCGLLPYAAKQSYEMLREKDIPKELAFMECWLEVKLIADAMVRLGPEAFFQLISPHALIGSEIAKQRIFDKDAHKIIEQLRNEIWSGDFFKEVNNLNETETRETILDRWRDSEITQTFNELKDDLIPS